MTKPDYKNWMPKGMVLGTLAGAAGCLGLSAVCGCTRLLKGKAKCGLTAALLLSGAAAGAAALWMDRMHRAFSYDGNRQMSRQIIEGIAAMVDLPEGGVGLDVGCGSGALTIACARRNPRARFVGIDRWGKEYPMGEGICLLQQNTVRGKCRRRGRQQCRVPAGRRREAGFPG